MCATLGSPTALASEFAAPPAPHTRFVTASHGRFRVLANRPTRPCNDAMNGNRRWWGIAVLVGLTVTGFGVTQRWWPFRRVAIVSAWAQGKNVPVEFWGRIVDQSATPIEGVSITATVREWYSLLTTAEAKFHQFDTKTDSKGLFHIRGAKGDGISIKGIAKAGYELLPHQAVSFSYSGPGVNKPAPNQPVLFKMWKKHGAMPLYVHDIENGGVVNGTALELNLADYHHRDESRDTSDLRITASRGGVSTNGLKRRYDWTATVEAVAGGLQVAADEFANLAPTNGYSNRVVIVSNSGDADWSREKKVRLYFRTRDNRQYGFVDLAVNVGETHPRFRVTAKSRVNPSGSPVLEWEKPLEINKDGFQRNFRY